MRTDNGSAPVKRRRKAAPGIAGYLGAPSRPAPKPVHRVAPPRAIYGPLTHSSLGARELPKVRRATDRAQRRAERNVVLPRIPSNLGRHQRGAASAWVARAAHRQGINTAQEVRNLPPAQRAIIRRAAQGNKTETRRLYRNVARASLPRADRGMAPGELERLGRQLVAAHVRTSRAKPGVLPRKVQIAGVDFGGLFDHTVGTLARKFESGQGAVLTHFLGHDALPFVGRAGSDAISIPQNAVLATYGLGHAGGRLLAGDPREAERLLKGLTHGAAGDLLRGDLKGFKHQLSTHPLYSVLDFSGLEGAVGRSAGAAARVGGRLGPEGNALARAGSTAREPLRLGDTGQVVERRYSPDLIRKSFQTAADRRRARQGEDPNVARGSRLKRELHRAADETAAQAEGMRRPGRSAAQNLSRNTERATPRSARDLVQGAVEGEFRAPATLEADLRRKHARLQDAWDHERASMTADEKRNNRSQRDTIEALFEDPKKMEKARVAIFAARDAYRPHADQVERDLIRTGALDAEQAKAAKLRTYAVAHMDARYEHRKSAPEDLVARHEQAKVVEQRARENLASVKKRLEAANARRGRLVGKHASQRGVDRARGGDPKALLRREADRAGSVDGATRNIKALRAEKRQAEAAWKKARRDRVASDPKKYVTGLVDAKTGARITTRLIEEHIAADPHASMPAFVSHRPAAGGTSAHFVNWLSGRKGADGAKVRTGEAARRGGQDPSFRALEDSLVRGQGIADAAKNFDRYVGDLGVKHPSGRPFTWDEAVKYNEARTHDANGDRIPGVVNMVPVRVVPARYDRSRADTIISGQGTAAHSDVAGITQKRLEEGLKPPTAAEKAKANVVLVPEQQVKRLMEHQTSGSSDIGKLGQAVTGAFRSTVLPFSTKWLTGNTVEAALRLAINDTPVGLVASRRAGKAVLKELEKQDAEAAKAFDVRATGGLQYGGQRTVYGGAERFKGTKFEKPSQAAAAIHQLPVVKQMTGSIGKFQHAVFAMNAKLEHAAQVVAVGKEARREMQAMTGSWYKAVTAQKAAIEDVARGLVNTPAQVRYARAVDEALGKYNRFSPELRRFTQTIAPFAPWYLNSVRFVMHTLPVRHPVKLALLANAEQTLNADFVAQHKDVPPGSLQGAIKTKDGGWLDLARFTPFGAFAEGAKIITDPILPQLSSVYAIMQGNSWTGNKLRLKDGSTVQAGSAKAVGLALYAAAESLFPGLSIARRLQEHGSTAFDDSTVFSPKTKPNTSHGSAVDRVFNPLRPTYLNKAGAPAAPLRGAAKSEYQRLVREAQGAAVAAPSREEYRSLLREAQAAGR